MKDDRDTQTQDLKSVLVAYGEANAQVLERCGIAGYVVRLTNATPEVRQPSLDLEAA